MLINIYFLSPSDELNYESATNESINWIILLITTSWSVLRAKSMHLANNFSWSTIYTSAFNDNSYNYLAKSTASGKTLASDNPK